MSFLDDSSATLHEALAFIDAHETAADSAVLHKPRKIGYWERLKAERESLRSQATTLEITLKRLQATAANPNGRARYALPHQSAGVRAPVRLEREFQRRLQAESTNQDLKSLVARNLKAIEILTAIAVQAPDNLSSIVSALLDRSSRLELNAVETLSRVGLLDAESFLHRTQREIHPQLGSVVETVSSVPLAISKHEADEALQRRFTADAKINSSHLQYTHLAVGGFTKSHSSTFAFGGQRFKLTTDMLLRRHVNAGIAVYVWIGVTIAPNMGVVFVEQALITARDPKPSAASAVKRPALFQYWYRIHTEETDMGHGDLPLADLELLKESAMRLRSHLSMRYIQSLENSLISGDLNGLPLCQPQSLELQ